MTDPTIGAPPGDPASDDPGLARFRRRGRWLFTALAILTVVVALLVLANVPGNLPDTALLLLVLGVVLGVVVDIALVVGLSNGRPWADHATVAVCWILLVLGLTRTVLRLLGGAIDIPLDSILAALVLSVKPAVLPPVDAADRPWVWIIVGITLVGAISGLAPR